jgi:hypothetical protein
MTRTLTLVKSVNPDREIVVTLSRQLGWSHRSQPQPSGGRHRPLTLVSADQDLNDAATAEGLTVNDPPAHP